MKIYVIMDRDDIGEVMRGERNQLPVTDPAPVGAVVAVQTARNRKPTVLLTVTACDPDPEGYTLTVRIRPLEHEPLLLAQDSSRGYTSVPWLAMRGEPEGIDVGVLDERWGKRAAGRHAKATKERQLQAQRDRQLLTVEQRMVKAREAARLNNVDVRDELKALRRMQANGRQQGSVISQLGRIETVAYREAA